LRNNARDKDENEKKFFAQVYRKIMWAKLTPKLQRDQFILNKPGNDESNRNRDSIIYTLCQIENEELSSFAPDRAAFLEKMTAACRKKMTEKLGRNL